MSFPASAIDVSARAGSVAELVAAGSIEISPRELHRAAEVAALVPAGTCAYVPSLPGLPVSRALEAVAAIRQAGLDPVPHVAARRSAGREPLREFLQRAAGEHGVHRVLLVGGDQPRATGPYSDTLQILEEGVLADTGIREIGIAGYPEGHPRIAPAALEEAFARKRRLAAEQGLGVAIGRGMLLEEPLAAGRLVAPFEVKLTTSHAYYFVCAAGSERVRKVALFHDWLAGEVAARSAGQGG